jgi:intracellular sulfur oxidation DsrE/DsrF family protein
MPYTLRGLVSALILTCAVAVPARAQSAPPLPVPGYDAARDLPGAHELPDPKTDYRVLFSVGQPGKDANGVNPMLPTIARYLNTLAKYGVPAEHRHLIVLFHQRSADIDLVMNNDAYKARYEGQDNPNLALIHALKAAGVEFRVCGQALFGRKIDPKQVSPDIQIDLWAMTSMVNLQLKGYVKIG